MKDMFLQLFAVSLVWGLSIFLVFWSPLAIIATLVSPWTQKADQKNKFLIGLEKILTWPYDTMHNLTGG